MFQPANGVAKYNAEITILQIELLKEISKSLLDNKVSDAYHCLENLSDICFILLNMLSFNFSKQHKFLEKGN
jgi:hypothetical protein